MLRRDLAERPDLIEPGIDEQCVDAAGVLLHGRIDAVDVAEISRIGADRAGAVADDGERLVELRLVAAGDEHPRAFLRETLGGTQADAGAAARHDGDLALKLLAHRVFLSARSADVTRL